MTYLAPDGQEWQSKKIYLKYHKNQKEIKKRKEDRENGKRDHKRVPLYGYYRNPKVAAYQKKTCERCEERIAVTTTWDGRIVCHPCHLSILDEYDSDIQARK